MIDSLPAVDVAGRIDRVRQRLNSAACEGGVLTDRSSIRWSCGFSGSAGVLVVTDDSVTLLTDGRYRERARTELAAVGSDVEIVITATLHGSGAELLRDCATVGFEAESITWAQQVDWVDAIAGRAVATRGIVAKLRSVKSAAELSRIEAAAAIVDEALAEVGHLIRSGTTERQLALAIDDGMRQRGAVGPGYATIVAGGPNSAIPHAAPSLRPFDDGDLVIVDAGAEVDGYRSDMTRTFVIGDASPKGQEIHRVVTEAQAAGVNAVEAGVEAGSIDAVCRSIISEAGFGEAFVHGTGHGVGLDIHELPAIRRDNPAILQPGHVITIEPGIYLPGLGGVRIEDAVVVTESGCRPLTKSPKIPL